MKKKRVNLTIDIPYESEIEPRLNMCDEEEAIEEVISDMVDMGANVEVVSIQIIGEDTTDG